MSPLKISALLSALVLAGCVVPPAQESASQSTAPVQVECGVASPPGCREPAVPAALKEFEHRWYLLAMDHQPSAGEKIMKCFGLDRISNLDIKQKTFPRQHFSAAERYRNSFGIIAPDGTPAEEIILQFDSHQGNYIKSMPLHHSQCVVEDGTDYLTIKLNLVPTYDFVQQLLHFGSRVKVIKPHALRITLQEELQKALNLY